MSNVSQSFPFSPARKNTATAAASVGLQDSSTELRETRSPLDRRLLEVSLCVNSTPLMSIRVE